MTELNVNLCFDMDGTLADLYARETWLSELRSYNPAPYAEAKPLVNMSALARMLNARQRGGYRLTIISWLSKTSTPEYDEAVTNAKLEWLAKHLPSVHWDEINIVPYGTPKQNFMVDDMINVLFDDEDKNLDNWDEVAINAADLMTSLRELFK